MSKIEQFDIDQLLLNLHGELSQVMAGAAVGKDGTRFQIQRLNFRMGQQLEDEQENSLDAERYPSKENWQVELSYEPGKDVLLGVEEKQSISCSDLMLERLSEHPLEVIKGLSTYWTKRWDEIGVKTIGSLYKFQPQKLWDIFETPDSQLLAHYSQVQQLQIEFPPLLFSKLKEEPLEIFWKYDVYQLQKRLQPLSVQQVQMYRNLAWRVATILDLSFVQSQKMEIWEGE